jgi:uncharacterized Zn ribbon protein
MAKSAKKPGKARKKVEVKDLKVKGAAKVKGGANIKWTVTEKPLDYRNPIK